MNEVLQWLNANGSGLSAVATIVTAAIAGWALRMTAADSRTRSQPVVLAEFRQAPDNRNAYELVVRNAGATVARDVSVIFEPAVVIVDGSNDTGASIVERYSHPISSLAPGQELANVWWSGRAEQGSDNLVNSLSTPENVTVTITYRGLGRKRLRETFTLEHRAMQWSYSISTDSIRGRVNQIAAASRSIAESLGTMSRQSSAVDRGLEAEDQAVSDRDRLRQIAAGLTRNSAPQP